MSGQHCVELRVKNRFTEPAPFGYRDMLLNVRLANGHIAEVQLGFDSLMMLKEWMHPNYALARPESTEELIDVCKERAGIGVPRRRDRRNSMAPCSSEHVLQDTSSRQTGAMMTR